MAIHQLPVQLLMAEEDRVRPMADDDGAGDDRREEAHDLLGAEHLEQSREDDVHQDPRTATPKQA